METAHSARALTVQLDEMLDAARADAVCAVRAAMEGLDMSSTPELEKLAADDPLALLTACVVQRVI